MEGKKWLWLLMIFLLVFEVVMTPFQYTNKQVKALEESKGELKLITSEVRDSYIIWEFEDLEGVGEFQVVLGEGLKEVELDSAYEITQTNQKTFVKVKEGSSFLKLKTIKSKRNQESYRIQIVTPSKTYKFVAKVDLADNNEEKDELVNRKASVQVQTLSPRVGDLNTDISIVSVKEKIESGQSALFKLVLKTTGSQKKYENAKLEVDLPIDDITHFEQDLNELKIAGVVPIYDEIAKKLIYDFENELKSGQIFERTIKLTPENLLTVNGKELKAKVTFTDKEKQFEDEASVEVKASNAITLNKMYVKSFKGGDLLAPTVGSYISWRVKVNIPKKEVGQMYLREGSEIIIKDTLPSDLSYSHMVKKGNPEPEVKGKDLIWKFKVPSLKEQFEADNEFFSVTLDYWTQLSNKSSLIGKKITNNAQVIGEFIDEKKTVPIKSNASVEVVSSDESTGDVDGSILYVNHRGPSDSKGGFGSNKEKNPDPKVEDDAYLGFTHAVTAMKPGSEYDMLAYETIYRIDKNLRIEQVRTPGNIRLGRTNEESSKQIALPAEVEYDIVAIVNGKLKTLVENAEHGRRYSRTELGLAPNDHVSEIRYVYKGPIPAGMYSGLHAQYFFSVKEGYVGKVENSVDVKITPDKRAYPAIEKHGEKLLSNGTWLYSYSSRTWETLAANTNATIVGKTKKPGPIGEVGVELLDQKSGEVVSGDNTMRVKLTNNSSSVSVMNKDLEAVVLLPLGVTLKDQANPVFKEVQGSSNYETLATVEVLNRDYNGSGRQLVKIKWDDNTLRPSHSLIAELDVNLSDDAPDTLKFDVYGYSANEDLRAPNNTGALVTDTILQEDLEDLNNNGKTENRLKSGNVYVKRGSYDLKTQKLVKGELDEEWSDIAKTKPGGDIEYRLKLTNDTSKDLSKMVLVDVLPSVGDLGITDNIARGSKFTPKLQGPIALPDEWEGKVEVKYSQAKTPKRDDLIKNTKYEDSTIKLTNPSTAENPNWMSANQVENWDDIHSFKIELIEGEQIIQGRDIDIYFNMKAPEAFELDKELLDQSIDDKERSACNSFAVATEHGQPVEPLQVCAYLDYELEEPEVSKTVNKQKDTYELESTHDKFTWEVKYEFGNHPRNWDSVILSDQIHEILKVTDVKVIDEAGNDVTDKGQVTVSDTNLVEFKLNKEDGNYNYLIDESYTLVIESKIIKETLKKDIHPFTQSNGIPNQAELIINDKPTPSNEVFVKPPEIRGSLALVKLDKETRDRLEGAEFELRKDGEKIAEGITNASGDLSFVDLSLGNYELVETKSPEGYRLLVKPIEVSISIDNLNVELEVENEVSNWELPDSGGKGALPYYLFGLLMMLSVVYFSGRNEKI